MAGGGAKHMGRAGGGSTGGSKPAEPLPAPALLSSHLADVRLRV